MRLLFGLKQKPFPVRRNIESEPLAGSEVEAGVNILPMYRGSKSTSSLPAWG